MVPALQKKEGEKEEAAEQIEQEEGEAEESAESRAEPGVDEDRESDAGHVWPSLLAATVGTAGVTTAGDQPPTPMPPAAGTDVDAPATLYQAQHTATASPVTQPGSATPPSPRSPRSAAALQPSASRQLQRGLAASIGVAAAQALAGAAALAAASQLPAQGTGSDAAGAGSGNVQAAGSTHTSSSAVHGPEMVELQLPGVTSELYQLSTGTGSGSPAGSTRLSPYEQLALSALVMTSADDGDELIEPVAVVRRLSQLDAAKACGSAADGRPASRAGVGDPAAATAAAAAAGAAAPRLVCCNALSVFYMPCVTHNCRLLVW